VNSSLRTMLVLFLPIAGILLALEVLLRPTPGERNYEALTEMVYSKAAESLSPNAVLPGQKTQQAVVAGVVVRGQMPFHYGLGQEEAARAGRELGNPFEDSPEVLERGGLIYRRFCVVCHAGDGGGQGPVVLRGMLPPPSLFGARAMAIADGEMFHVLTLGQGNMASYAAQVSAADRWKVIRHVRSMQEASR
jgi:mono/diheme cytochrome c family protein